MRNNNRALLMAGMMALPFVSAHADYLDQNLAFSGFGTVGTAFSNNDMSDYRANYEQNQGVGRTTSRDYGLDTVFGFQADLNIIDNLSATAQLQSHRLSDGTSNPYLEWANVKYSITPDLSVRVGRVVAPMFLVSESRSVGYAQTAARLPVDVYSMNPVRYMDGAGINYVLPVGNVLYKANLTAGKLDWDLFTALNSEPDSAEDEAALPEGYSLEAGKFNSSFNIKIASLSAEWGASKVRFGVGKFDFDLKSDLLKQIDEGISLAADYGFAGAALDRENIRFSGVSGTIYTLGYVLDTPKYIVQTELVARRSNTLTLEEFDSFYVLGAYRLGRWTPFIQYSRANSLLDKRKISQIDNPFNINDLDSLNHFLRTAMATTQESSTWALGARWDIKDNYDIKLQYERVSKPANSTGFFVNAFDDFVEEEQKVNVYSVSLDFVF